MKSLNIDYYQYVEDVLAPQDIHDANMADRITANSGAFVMAAIVLSVLHAAILYLAVATELWAGLPVLAHLVIATVTCLWAFGQYKMNSDVPFLALLAITSSVAGVFGAAGTLLCYVLQGIFRQKAYHFKEWFELIFPPDIISAPEEVYNNIVVGIDENPIQYGVIPFIDVMDMGSEEQKHRALSKMTMKFHPRMAPAFQKALRDNSNAIRVQAATAVAKIEAQFMARLEKIEQAREKEPSNLHVHFALARHYDDYAYTGLLDPEREILNREKAIETYKSYLQHDPNNLDAYAAIGRLLFRGKRWEEAAEWFRRAMDKGWKLKNMTLWYMECLYRLGDYRALRTAARQFGSLSDHDDLPREVRDAVAIWARA